MLKNKNMQINIAEVIIDLLFAEEQVSLPGVGKFELERHSAAFNSAKQKLEPPYETIIFSEEYDDSTTMVQAISSKYQISEKKSSKALTTFSTKVLNGFLNYNQVHIKNLGTLERDENSTIKFSTSKVLQEWLTNALPMLNVTAIPKHTKKTLEQPFVEKKDPNVLTPAVSKSTVASQDNTKVESVVKPIIEKENVVHKEEKWLKGDDIKDDDSIFTTKQTHRRDEPYEEEKFSKTWLYILLLAAGLATGLFYGINYLKSNKGVTLKENVGVVDLENDKVTADTLLNNADNIEEKLTTATNQSTDVKPKECIIIVGSYRNENNIQDMLYKIKSSGYKTYTEKYGPYIRVGFSFDCNGTDLKEFIVDIRQKLGKNSWYLVPNVEY